jgi:hypothetical protein
MPSRRRGPTSRRRSAPSPVGHGRVSARDGLTGSAAFGPIPSPEEIVERMRIAERQQQRRLRKQRGCEAYYL